MIEPKDKAKELIEKFSEHALTPDFDLLSTLPNYRAKECALICVREIRATSVTEFDTVFDVLWRQVEDEINKL